MKNNISKIQQNIRRLKNQIYELSEANLSHKPNPKKWSKKEILGHLIDSARYNLARFTEIPFFEGTYQVTPYQQDDLVVLNNYQNVKLSELVILCESLNKQICYVIEKVPEKDYQKIINYVNSEEKTFQWLVDDYVRHLAYHLEQILSTSKMPSEPACHITQAQAIEKLKQESSVFTTLLTFGDLEIEYYQPNKIDHQTPHSKDEVYIIAQGTGTFICEDKTYAVKTHDVLFVKAGEVHRFVDFSDDFATWVIFYGLDR